MSAKLCRSKEGGATGTAVVRLGRCPWATATFDMKTSKQRAITIKWNFIFTPQSVSRVASKLWCLFLRVAHDLAYRREVSIRLGCRRYHAICTLPTGREESHYGNSRGNKTGSSYRTIPKVCSNASSRLMFYGAQ